MSEIHVQDYLLLNASSVAPGKWVNTANKTFFTFKTAYASANNLTVQIETRDEQGNIFVIDSMTYNGSGSDIMTFNSVLLEVRANITTRTAGAATVTYETHY